jgi:hypothetical protein
MTERLDVVDTCEHTAESDLEHNPVCIEKVRRCLMCWADFLSQWSGERICAKCRARSAWRSGG